MPIIIKRQEFFLTDESKQNSEDYVNATEINKISKEYIEEVIIMMIIEIERTMNKQNENFNTGTQEDTEENFK